MRVGYTDAEVVGRDPFAMKRVDAADLAEEMAGGPGVEPVFAERLFAGKQGEPCFMHLDHECILPAADRAVTHRKFGKVGLDLEADGAAVATSKVFLHWTTTHTRSRTQRLLP